VQSSAVRRIETALAPRFSSRVVVMSDAIAAMFRGPDGCLPRNLVKLHDGVDLQVFRPGRDGMRVRRELGIPDGTALVGTVSRLDPWKGVDVFLQAAARVVREAPSVRFLVCGGEIPGHQGYEADLRRQAAALGLGRAVLFAGWRYRHLDIPDVYAALDVSVQCPVHPEPYGLANIEAMACATPIVAVAEGGPVELCVHGETALLVPPRNPDAIAEAVLALLRNPEKGTSMGAAGRRRAEELFDRRDCVKALESLYNEVLGNNR
jgi:glycosyltransferase involved in cell wall biosynthesis